MPHPTVEEIRNSRESFREYVTQLHYNDIAAEFYPIRSWGERAYIVLSRLDVVPERQFIEVVDITDDPNIARFSNRWPDREPRDHALILTPSQGSGLVLQEDGGGHALHYAELWVRLVSATRSEMLAQKEKQGEGS